MQNMTKPISVTVGAGNSSKPGQEGYTDGLYWVRGSQGSKVHWFNGYANVADAETAAQAILAQFNYLPKIGIPIDLYDSVDVGIRKWNKAANRWNFYPELSFNEPYTVPAIDDPEPPFTPPAPISLTLWGFMDKRDPRAKQPGADTNVPPAATEFYGPMHGLAYAVLWKDSSQAFVLDPPNPAFNGGNAIPPPYPYAGINVGISDAPTPDGYTLQGANVRFNRVDRYCRAVYQDYDQVLSSGTSGTSEQTGLFIRTALTTDHPLIFVEQSDGWGYADGPAYNIEVGGSPPPTVTPAWIANANNEPCSYGGGGTYVDQKTGAILSDIPEYTGPRLVNVGIDDVINLPEWLIDSSTHADNFQGAAPVSPPGTSYTCVDNSFRRLVISVWARLVYTLDADPTQAPIYGPWYIRSGDGSIGETFSVCARVSGPFPVAIDPGPTADVTSAPSEVHLTANLGDGMKAARCFFCQDGYIYQGRPVWVGTYSDGPKAFDAAGNPTYLTEVQYTQPQNIADFLAGKPNPTIEDAEGRIWNVFDILDQLNRTATQTIDSDKNGTIAIDLQPWNSYYGVVSPVWDKDNNNYPHGATWQGFPECYTYWAEGQGTDLHYQSIGGKVISGPFRDDTTTPATLLPGTVILDTPPTPYTTCSIVEAGIETSIGLYTTPYGLKPYPNPVGRWGGADNPPSISVGDCGVSILQTGGQYEAVVTGTCLLWVAAYDGDTPTNLNPAYPTSEIYQITLNGGNYKDIAAFWQLGVQGGQPIKGYGIIGYGAEQPGPDAIIYIGAYYIPGPFTFYVNGNSPIMETSTQSSSGYKVVPQDQLPVPLQVANDPLNPPLASFTPYAVNSDGTLNSAAKTYFIFAFPPTCLFTYD